MGKYEAYNQYKDSGIAWIGQIPEHWEIRNSRRLFSQRKERVRPEDKQLTASQKYGVIYQSEFMEKEGRQVTQVVLNSEILKHVEKNDFVISMRSFQGGIELCEYSGSVSSAYVPLIPAKEIEINYFKRLFKSKRFIEALSGTSNLVRDGQALRYQNFVQLTLPLPPYQEQGIISRFLEYKLAKINRFVHKKKLLIKLLNEQKAAIINQAITKGLDPNVKMKNSGIEWLGDIPWHWDQFKLKYLITKPIAGAWGAEPKNDSSDIICVRVADFKDYEIKTENLTVRNIEARQEQLLKPGDLLLEKSGGGEKTPVGRVVLFNGNFKAVTSNFVSKFSPKADLISSEYLLFIFKLINSVKWNFKSIKQTTGIQNIDTYQYMDNWVFIPKIEEQVTIVTHIKNEFIILDETISKIEKEIVLVEEYKTALITEAVTGKIDVREYEVPEKTEVETYEEIEEEMNMASEDEGEYENAELEE